MMHEMFEEPKKAGSAASGAARPFAVLPDLRRVVALPAIFGWFPPFDFARPTVNPIAVDYRIRFGISAAFGIVVFAENKLKISVGSFFRVVADTIHGNAMCIDAVVLKCALE